ncbi:MAG TPA: OmpA family protein [Polyangiaceae bacterium]|nr:OmpA family protein [Polyangiaceae bacterium]
MGRPTLLHRLAKLSAKWSFAAVAATGLLLGSVDARAQQHTFHLDRLEVPGAPDDGLVLFRPVVRHDTILYTQLGLGFSIDPLRTRDISNQESVLRASPSNVITSQISTYMSAGFQLLERLTLGATLPIAWEEAGNQPQYPTTAFGGAAYTTFSTTGPAVGDMRIDARYILWVNEDGTQAVGLQAGLFVPTGAGSSTNFGGDGSFGAIAPMLTGEWTPRHFATLVANVGVAWRGENSVNDPAGNHGPPQGLGIGDELRLAIGAFLPVLDGKVRLGATIFTQTGLTGSGDTTVGNTIFTLQNTPIEWNFEARTKLPVIGWDHYYIGGGLGTRLSDGYGAPDFRFVALIGTYFPLEDTNPKSPEARMRVRESIRESMRDSDGDGIPDDVDACPTVPEDHKEPDPLDGCPQEADRDGDGIPDKFDKCPDEPEDKDGIDDQDGCPEDDADKDGIPDAKDACPKEPGQPDPDPKKNGCPKFIHLEGSTVRVLQQVHFETASATILPDSFPMLTEIVQLLKANPSIKKMRIEGHTDNRGGADMNLDLSKRRAASVREWLVQHGIESGRLESEGYGLTRPIESNDTDAGRAANRRVEFKITEEDTK